jgi:hypothetical protein
MLVLVRALPDDVARRVVAADDKDAGAVVADDAVAPDGGGGAPHDLRVVAAHLPLRARVGVVVVVLLLAQPRPHGVCRRPVAAGGAPEDVLAVRPAGVHERAVALALRRVALHVYGDVVVVRNKPIARASTGLITFRRGPATRVAVVSMSELSPCPDRAAIEQLAPVYACVMGVCLQLAAYAAWWSCMESVAATLSSHDNGQTPTSARAAFCGST